MQNTESMKLAAKMLRRATKGLPRAAVALGVAQQVELARLAWDRKDSVDELLGQAAHLLVAGTAAIERGRAERKAARRKPTR
jgi:hypothetical protein